MEQARKTLFCDPIQKSKYTGKGIGIAVLDTGITYHPDFYTGNHYRIAAFKDFVNHSKMPYDDHGHGTHVCGICSGNGQLSKGMYAGIAPESHLIVGKILDQMGNGNIHQTLDAIDWVIENRQNYGIRILNISVGSETDSSSQVSSLLVKSAEKAWDSGLIVIAAAGNKGPGQMSITSPGISKKIITVGSCDDYKPFFSGVGPTRDCIQKPEVIAPGSQIISCNYSYYKTGTPYAVRSGTSMSTPMVSGAVALLLESHPDMTNKEVKLKIKASCVPINTPHVRQGWGMLNIKKLLL